MNFLLKANPTLSALISATVAFALLIATFMILEPAASRAASSDAKTVVVGQTITADLSFKSTTTVQVTLGSLSGLTGGQSSGSTTAVVTTNNTAGYNMTIGFASTTAMGLDGGGSRINNYNATAPTYSFNSQLYGQFGYTAYSTTDGLDVDAAFRSSGGTCGSGASVANHCWMAPSTTAKQIVNATSSTPATGATTTVAFHVLIPQNPNPAIKNGTYHATATLTATAN